MTSLSLPASARPRILSGMRPTGALHIGHFHGALKNWVTLQDSHECFYFVADWHALTTHYEDNEVIGRSVQDMVIDWLAAGLDPERATIFMQSRVPQHAELTLLLGMCTPLAWLERVPTYKDQITKLADKDLSTYGFLGYPLMQAADILIYQANGVPVGEDQVPHIEITREIARRFNNIFGRESGFQDKLRAAGTRLGEQGKRYFALRKQFQQEGLAEARREAELIVAGATGLEPGDRQRLRGYLDGEFRAVLTEPVALLTEASKLPGLDGAKMSKSYGNTIALRETPEAVAKKVKQMPTDPQRVRRTDPGDPERCPVWKFHQVYSNADTQAWVQQGCRSAGIGCIECKTPVAEAINAELAPVRERAAEYAANPQRVRDILEAGCARARTEADRTMQSVREAMGLAY